MELTEGVGVGARHGLVLAAVGSGVLTQVGSVTGLTTLVAGSVIVSLGLAAVFTVTTDLVVSAAPPERAGAASALSETGSEFGGALGIAILGTLGAAVYRTQISATIPGDVPQSAAVAARDTLAAELGEDAEGIQSLHHGGEHHWATLIEQTASMWLDYLGLTPTQVATIVEPALVLAGDRDQFIPLDLSVALYRALTHAELAIIPAADHSAPFTPERATVFAALIGDFAERYTRDYTTEQTGTRIMSLNDARAETRLPAQDLDRARRWYAEKLGLEPAEERPGGLRYRCASGVFCLFDSSGPSDGTFTQLALNVTDIDSEVAELRRRGVQFEDIDMPGFTTIKGIVDVDGNYPSKGGAERGAFFRDSENNMIALGQPLP